MAERSTNTLTELRHRWMKEIAGAKLAMDLSEPDMMELLELENILITKAKQPMQQMQSQGMLPPDGASSGLPFQAPMPQPGGAGMGGLQTGGGVPLGAVDELRRMLG